MCTQPSKLTQLTQQTQLITSPGGSDNEAELAQEDDLIWGRLFPIGASFKAIG